MDLVQFYSDRIHKADARAELCELLATLAIRGALSRDGNTATSILAAYDTNVAKSNAT